MKTTEKKEEPEKIEKPKPKIKEIREDDIYDIWNKIETLNEIMFGKTFINNKKRWQRTLDSIREAYKEKILGE